MNDKTHETPYTLKREVVEGEEVSPGRVRIGRSDVNRVTVKKLYTRPCLDLVDEVKIHRKSLGEPSVKRLILLL